MEAAEAERIPQLLCSPTPLTMASRFLTGNRTACRAWRTSRPSVPCARPPRRSAGPAPCPPLELLLEYLHSAASFLASSGESFSLLWASSGTRATMVRPCFLAISGSWEFSGPNDPMHPRPLSQDIPHLPQMTLVSSRGTVSHLVRRLSGPALLDCVLGLGGGHLRQDDPSGVDLLCYRSELGGIILLLHLLQ